MEQDAERLEREIERFRSDFTDRFNKSRGEFLSTIRTRSGTKAYKMAILKQIQEKIKDLATELDEMQMRHDKLRKKVK